MVRRSSSKKKSEAEGEPSTAEPEPEVLERKRLKKLALSKNILSNTPAKPYPSLAPSKTVVKHHGKDILRKSQRKNKFLFSFPGLLAPIAGGGKIGELKDLASKNPVLYLHFPQGQMKLFGTILYSKNRYLTLHFSRGGKNVMCEDYFDNMIVFSDAWWIGTKEENPEEVRLDFPKELIKGQPDEYDFKGGAGGTSVNKLVGKKSEARAVEVESPETELETDSSDDKTNLRDLKDVTPSRYSARMAGKTFKFTEVSSGDDSLESDNEIFQKEEKVKASSARVLNIDNEIASTQNHSKEDQSTAVLESKLKRSSESSVTVATSKEDSHVNQGSLVQATISSLFKKVQGKEKVEEKKATSASRKLSLLKDSSQMQQNNLKRKTDKVEAKGSNKRTKVTKGEETGTKAKAKKKQLEDEDGDDDGIEDFSSSSEDGEASDEDWEA